MLSIKDSAQKIINDLPDDISFDELIKELAFKRMIEKGLQDSLKNKITPDEELEKEIEKWSKEKEVEDYEKDNCNRYP